MSLSELKTSSYSTSTLSMDKLLESLSMVKIETGSNKNNEAENLQHSSNFITNQLSFPLQHNNESDFMEMDPLQIWTPNVIFRVVTIGVVMVLTLVGNVSLIAVISCHASLRSKRVSIFLLNLAVADLLVCIFTMTSEILFVAFGQWVLGAIACKIIVYGQIITLASTTFLLTAMSIDRYQVLVQPLQPLRGPQYIWCRMVAAWVLAMIFATPQLFIFVQTEEQRPDGQIIRQCKSAGYTAEWQRKVYFSYMTAYILIIPTGIMTYCYSNIIKVVWMRTGDPSQRDIDAPRIHFVTRRPVGQVRTSTPLQSLRTGISSRPAPGFLYGQHAPNEYSHRLDTAQRSIHASIPRKIAVSSKRNVIKMTMTVIVGFVICWTPYFVISLIRIYSDYRIQLENALSLSEIMALVHSALNPMLYMLFSTRTVRSLCWPVNQRRLCNTAAICCCWVQKIRDKCLNTKTPRGDERSRISPESSTVTVGHHQPVRRIATGEDSVFCRRSAEATNSNSDGGKRKHLGFNRYGSSLGIRFSRGSNSQSSGNSSRHHVSSNCSSSNSHTWRSSRFTNLEHETVQPNRISTVSRDVQTYSGRSLRPGRAELGRTEGYRSMSCGCNHTEDAIVTRAVITS